MTRRKYAFFTCYLLLNLQSEIVLTTFLTFSIRSLIPAVGLSLPYKVTVYNSL